MTRITLPIRAADDSQPPQYDEIVALEDRVQSEDKSPDSRRQHDETKLLVEDLAQARERIQQLEDQLNKQKAEHLAETNKLFRDFHSEKQDLLTQARQSQKDRDDLGCRQCQKERDDYVCRQCSKERIDCARELAPAQGGFPTPRHQPDIPNAVPPWVTPTPTPTRKLNPSLNVLDAQGGFPLYGAAAGGHYAEVERMLAEGADPSMRTSCDWTALHWAAGNGHTSVVGLLLSYGADVNAVSDTGRRPLGMAKTEEIKTMLIQRGATG